MNDIYIEFASNKTLHAYIIKDIDNINNYYKDYFNEHCANFDEVIIKEELINVNDIYIKKTFADAITVYLILPIDGELEDKVYISYFDDIITLGHPDADFYFCKIQGNFRIIHDTKRFTLKKYTSSENIVDSLLHEEYMASNDIHERVNFFINTYIVK
jgi:hypothetical protein